MTYKNIEIGKLKRQAVNPKYSGYIYYRNILENKDVGFFTLYYNNPFLLKREKEIIDIMPCTFWRNQLQYWKLDINEGNPHELKIIKRGNKVVEFHFEKQVNIGSCDEFVNKCLVNDLEIKYKIEGTNTYNQYRYILVDLLEKEKDKFCKKPKITNGEYSIEINISEEDRYWITLYEIDIDEITGNMHSNYGRVQFWKLKKLKGNNNFVTRNTFGGQFRKMSLEVDEKGRYQKASLTSFTQDERKSWKREIFQFNDIPARGRDNIIIADPNDKCKIVVDKFIEFVNSFN